MYAFFFFLTFLCLLHSFFFPLQLPFFLSSANIAFDVWCLGQHFCFRAFQLLYLSGFFFNFSDVVLAPVNTYKRIDFDR